MAEVTGAAVCALEGARTSNRDGDAIGEFFARKTIRCIKMGVFLVPMYTQLATYGTVHIGTYLHEVGTRGLRNLIVSMTPVRIRGVSRGCGRGRAIKPTPESIKSKDHF